MSKNKTRECPACLKTSSFRADQKTCGCGGPNPNMKAGDLDSKVKALLLSKPLTLVELADKLEVAPKHVKESVDRLKEAGHNVDIRHEQVSLNKDVQIGNEVV